MTTHTIAEEKERRRRMKPARSPAGRLADVLDVQRDDSQRWPDPRWQADPVGHARTILGVDLWERQIEFLEAIRDNRRVAVSGGRKVGKDFSVGLACLWWYDSFDDARAIMMATTGSQIDRILWRDIRKLYFGSGICLACKLGRCEDCRKLRPYDSSPCDHWEKFKGKAPCPHSASVTGEIHMLARSGLKAPDGREITGHTAREAEAIAGTSGARLLYVLDEASGIDDALHVAVRGNLASAQCREVALSNPTRNEGWYFDAFHSKKDLYRRIVISSRESPNIVEGREVFPGLASSEWLEEQKRDWGEDSALWAVHIEGKFAENEQNKIFALHLISLATKRWEETEAVGRLQIGIDVAGEGEKGDEGIFIPRKGQKMLELLAFRGLTADEYLAHTLGLVRKYKKIREPLPLVCVDREGPVGFKVWTRLRAFADDNPDVFDVAGVRASDGAIHTEYDRRRDELWGSAALWVREGGSLLTDPKLEAELHCPQWIRDMRGRNKVTPKRDMKKILKRSPDRAEAFVLSVWVPIEHELGGDGYHGEGGNRGRAEDNEGIGGIDPYALEGLPDSGDDDPIYGRR